MIAVTAGSIEKLAMTGTSESALREEHPPNLPEEEPQSQTEQ